MCLHCDAVFADTLVSNVAHTYEKSVVNFHCFTYIMHSVMRCFCVKTLVKFIFKCAQSVEAYRVIPVYRYVDGSLCPLPLFDLG